MNTIEIVYTLRDIIAITLFGGTFVCIVLFYIIRWIYMLLWQMLFCKCYAKLYNPYPQMHLDRKYGVKYRKHLWNKWKYVLVNGYDNNMTYYEAMQKISNLRTYGTTNKDS